MILEIAQLHIRPGQTQDFEIAFSEAQKIIMAAQGYISHELQRCVENANHYMLLIRWQTLEDHTIGFRESEAFQVWRQALHHFYDPPAVVQHYEKLF